MICAFIGVSTLTAPSPTASQGLSLLQILGVPTPEIFLTPTPIETVTYTAQPLALVIPPREAPQQPTHTPTVRLNLGFPLIIRQPTVTALPTQTKTQTPTPTSTLIPAAKKRNKSPAQFQPPGAPTGQPAWPTRTLKPVPPAYRPTGTPPPIRGSRPWSGGL